MMSQYIQILNVIVCVCSQVWKCGQAQLTLNDSTSSPTSRCLPDLLFYFYSNLLF